jgi:hypothetical protein
VAIYHLSMKTISRSAGRSSTGAAAYRAGCLITDSRTGEVHDYRRKKGIESSDLILPDGVPEMDRADFWNAVENHHKRGDAVTAREIVVALPSELPPHARRELAVDFSRRISNHYKVAADASCHLPDKKGDDRNHHAHIEISACSVTSNGLGKKVAELDPIHCQRHKIKNPAEHWREVWADMCNAKLREYGIDAQIDHRTLEAQKIDRQPTKHLGPAATEFERRTGKKSNKRSNHEAKARKAEVEKLHQAQDARDLEKAEKEVKELTAKLADTRARKAAWIARAERRLDGEPNRIMTLDQTKTRDGRTLYKWAGSGASAGKIAVIQKGNSLSAAGKFTKPKAAAMAHIAQENGWKEVTITGSPEFKTLAMHELLKRGIKIQNPELQDHVEAWKVAQARAAEQKKMVEERDRLARSMRKKIDDIKQKNMEKAAPQPEKQPTVDERAEAYAALVKAVSEHGTVKPIEPGKMYVGPIREISACGRFAMQSLGRGTVAVHDLSKLEGSYQIGQNAHISYLGSIGRDKKQAEQSRDQGPGVTR